MKVTSPVPTRLSVPPFWAAPVPGLSPCRPLFRLTLPPAFGPVDDVEPPHAATASATAASPETASELRVRVRIDTLLPLSSLRLVHWMQCLGGQPPPRRNDWPRGKPSRHTRTSAAIRKRTSGYGRES